MRGCVACLATVALLGVAACGGEERQDADEPAGSYPVDVVRATFPTKQRLADQTTLEITVRNAGDKVIPNVATTIISGEDPGGGEVTQAGGAQAFAEPSEQPDLADPSRPIWVLDAGPRGGVTAYTNTWALGRVEPGAQKTFRWRVTAVKPGVHPVRYRIAAGLDGKAKAVLAGSNRAPEGRFVVNVSGKPADARVGADGKVIKTEPR